MEDGEPSTDTVRKEPNPSKYYNHWNRHIKYESDSE